EERRLKAERYSRERGQPPGGVVRLRRRELADLDEAVPPEGGEVDRGHERAEGDVGADVGGRLGAANVLLARLEREHEAPSPVTVHGGADARSVVPPGAPASRSRIRGPPQ